MSAWSRDIEALLEAAKRVGSDPPAEDEARGALEQLLARDEETVRMLAGELSGSRDRDDRALAARLLGAHLSAARLQALLRLLEHERDQAVLATIAEALQRYEGELPIEQLEMLANHEDDELRRIAAARLYGRDDQRTLSLLLGLVEDPDPDVAGWAAWALADGFKPSADRDLALERWLRLTPAGSQLATQVKRSLQEQASVTRHPRGRSRTRRRDRQSRKAPERLLVLVTSANPIDTGRLALDEEVRDITSGVRATPARDVVDLRTAWAARPLDLLTELNEHHPAVLHFSGHGTADGRLVFLDAAGEAKPVDGEAFAASLATAGGSVRVVVLNACFSADLARSLTQFVDVAVGMERPVGDVAARVFARAFYSALGFGVSVGGAFEQGRAALALEGMPEKDIAQLSARVGVDPHELVLVDPEAARRYVPASDQEVLRQRTQTHLAHLARHASLPLGDGLCIQRDVGEPLSRRAREGSMLVVGAPGSGKTGALHSLALELIDAGRDVVVLAADLLGASGQSGLREELDLQRNVFDALAAWPGEQPGFLLIDALDAARGREAATALLSLVAQVAADSRRWHVIASVRSFDLRHSPELQDAFPADPADAADGFTDPEFTSVRHLAVGALSERELGVVTRSSPPLAELLQDAPPALGVLARSPLNLQLLCSLLAREGAGQERLSALGTQLQLLDLYWDRQVLSPVQGRDTRHAVLVRLCELAVKRMRLQVPRTGMIEGQGDAEALEELLGCGVLVETRQATGGSSDEVAFAHHLLFDYAVHRLLLDGEDDEVTARLRDTEELVLLTGPSLVLTLQARIAADPSWSAFWTLALRLADPQVPALARLIAPSVAVEHLRQPQAFEPLLISLERGEPGAAFLLRHIVSAETARGRPAHPLADADLSLWSALAEMLAREVSSENAYPLRLLVWGLSMELEDLNPVQLQRLGRAARALLAWAWDQATASWPDVQTGIEAVARSCASNPQASREILLRALSPERVSDHGYLELWALAQEIRSLLSCAPDLVSELYRTVFGRDEPSKAPTPLGTGQILRLASNRQQDWNMIRYVLAEQYPLVLEREPGVAVRAAGAACLHEGERYAWSVPRVMETFMFRERKTGMIDDGSEFWDSGEGLADDAGRLLDAFQQTLVAAAGASDTERVDAFLDAVAGDRHPAGIFRRLLRAGAETPAFFAEPLFELVRDHEILTDISTSEPAGAFLAAASGYWDERQRAAVEEAILRVPDRFPADRKEAGLHARDRLLGCLDHERIVTEQAREVLEELKLGEGPPANIEPHRVSVGAVAVDPLEEMRRRGIDPDASGNARLLSMIAPVSEFVGTHANSPPSPEQADAAVKAIRALRAGRIDLQGECDPVLLAEAEAWLSDAAATLAAQTPLSGSRASVRLARELAIDGRDGVLPSVDADTDPEGFESFPHWSVPSGRVGAARALLLLTREPALTDAEVLSAIGNLALDPAPAVRLNVARLLGLARASDPEWAWALTRQIAEHESSGQVLQTLLSALVGLAREQPARAFDLTEEIYERELAGPRRESLLSGAAGLLIDGWIWEGHPAGRRVIDGWLTDPGANAASARSVFFRLRKPVTAGDDTLAQIAVRQRAIGVWADLTRAAWDAFQAVGPVPLEQDVPALRGLAQLLDASASELYFASGAYGEQQPERGERLPPRVRRRFYREGEAMIEVLTAAGVPSVAHRVLQTLSTYVQDDPRGVLLRIGRLLQAGRAWGYQLESLAEAEFVALVERYLAAHRDLFLRDRECREVLVGALEGFVEAGWPSARRMMYGLDDMFR